MLFKRKHQESGKTLHHTRPLLVSPQQAYMRPPEGKAWFMTTTTVWPVNEMIRRSVRDWRRLTGEDGHTGTRAQSMRQDHDSSYTGTVSVFPAPLVEWILLRYGGGPGSTVLDAFAGGPPRGMVSTLMGFKYTGFEIRQEQIDENLSKLKELRLSGAKYILGDGTRMEGLEGKQFNLGFTCPPYYDLEVYSELPEDLSNFPDYDSFRGAISSCANAYWRHLKPGAFLCFVVGCFRDSNGELIDFRGHCIEDFRQVGFVFWQDVVLEKNFASAAVRSTNAWKGKKLVPQHEYLLVFRKPGWEK